jgi:hypothetical protein
MTVGPYAGRKVSEAKPIIRDEMVAAGQAMPYSEPEKTVGAWGVAVVVGSGRRMGSWEGPGKAVSAGWPGRRPRHTLGAPCY